MTRDIPEPIQLLTLVGAATGLGIAPLMTIASIIDGYSPTTIALITISTPVCFALIGLWIGILTVLLDKAMNWAGL